MEEDQLLSEELTCSICNKSCANRKALLRHISYCKKSKFSIQSRKKSCLTCTKAKTRCDLAYPSCSRCVTKNLVCGYKQHRLLKTPVTQMSEIQVIQSPEAPGQPNEELPLNPATTLNLASLFPLHESTDPFHSLQNLTLGPTEFISSDSTTWNFESADLISTYLDSVPAQTIDQCPPFAPSVMDLTPRSSIAYQVFENMDTNLYESVIFQAPKLFWPRTIRNHQLSLNRRHVICTLKSYPLMILPGKPPPPFIHPHVMTKFSQKGQVIDNPLPRPLANCAAIIQMCLVKDTSNATFIWRAIRMEQERFSTECEEYDGVNAVAALQAMTIYFLLRLSEDNDEATNFDTQIICTMTRLCVQATQQVTRHGTISDGRIPTWKDWILGESLNRTIIIAFIADLFFDVFSSIFENCDGEWLSSMSLPCARDLWRATSSADWEREYLARGDDMSPEKQLTYGDLLKSRSTSTEDHALDSWLSQLDDFGNFVVAAASLTQ